ncbi:MGMT family protein [Desulfovibrio sp. OttesenSCG-928-C06]|nr:MGMT family protein [Desulfovibrio sp. OttesenSCG-928-C06]
MAKSNFFNDVYALVEQIPPGKVMTYGQIAACLQSPYSAKVVGYAMSSAPDGRNLPCHRVVNRKGEMAGGMIFGGVESQRSMLEREGVPFKANGLIDLTLALWDCDGAMLPE